MSISLINTRYSRHPTHFRFTFSQKRTACYRFRKYTLQLGPNRLAMVELRKRKEAPPAPVRPAKKTAPVKGKKAVGDQMVVAKAQATVAETVLDATKDEEKEEEQEAGPPQAGDIVKLATFGGEIETDEGKKTSLAKLVEESKGGVVLFTYPKASTPGCTTQVCLFRDSFDLITAATGYSIYGLSSDSTKANTTFKTKHKLPYPLLCDPAQALISTLGFKKQPKGTLRGVFVVDKEGKVLASEPGGPAKTLEVVRKLVNESKRGATKEGSEEAKTAVQVTEGAAQANDK